MGRNLSIVRRSRVVHLLKEHGANLLTNVQINEITREGVLYEHNEEAHLAKADQVIIAMGANLNLDLANALQSRKILSTAIGDCTSVGYIHGAIADARNAVLRIEDLA